VHSFIVIGAGAVGSYIGGRLAASGAAVCFVARQYSIDALGTTGLKLSDLDGFECMLAPNKLNLFSSLEQLSAQQLKNANESAPIILVCVKSGATDAVGKDIARFCRAGSHVISFQNGVENVARLKRQAPDMNVLAGMVPYNIMMKSPNHCHRATAGTLFIERFILAQQIGELLNAAGLSAQFRNDMTEVQWGKLLLNLNNPVNALSNLPLKTQLQDRHYRQVSAALQKEALFVLGRAGIKPAKVGKVSPQLLPKLLNLPDWLFNRIASSMLKMDASARSSMWVDLTAGKPTEIDDLCGAIDRLAKSNGLAATANAAMVKLIETSRANESWNGKKLLHEITRQ
jgi:2-dehydropantoate 2-reductase